MIIIRLALMFAILMTTISLLAQHTFSIVAIDSVTGEIGSAGATCLNTNDCGGCGGAIIISGLVKNKGAINAQAQVCLPNTNLENGMVYINDDLNADDCLAELLTNDDCIFGGINDRQYGIVTLQNGSIHATAYTGNNTLDYANHRIGADYAIQGNILLGPEVLDEMENGFLNTEGLPLGDRLMAAMQGANIPGADSRCLVDGISSKSAFIRVSRPDDGNAHYLDINIPITNPGIDPIDDLQEAYDAFNMVSSNDDIKKNEIYANVIQNGNELQFIFEEVCKNCSLQLYSISGALLYSSNINSTMHKFNVPVNQSNILLVNIIGQDELKFSKQIYID